MNKIEHLLVCLGEECSEVQKEVSKALRFGLDERWKNSPSNAERIAYEFCDLLAVLEMLQEEGVISVTYDNELIRKKKKRVRKYMEYSRECGVLDKGEGVNG